MTRLSDFLLHEILGSGGTGRVYRATHMRTDVEVAIKLISPRKGDLWDEIRAMASLDHPNIAQIYDHGRVSSGNQTLEAGSQWFAMELGRSGTLAQLSVPLPWDRQERIIQCVLDGLAHAHAREILHRDIKPENVLLDTPRAPVSLGDFGLAGLSHEASSAHVRGTPRYLAPERVQTSAGPQGPWTDLYSLGCLVWWMATGQTPYRGSTDELVLSHIAKPLPPFVPGVAVPDGLGDWLQWMLHKDPRSRFTQVADAAYALSQLSSPSGLPRTPVHSATESETTQITLDFLHQFGPAATTVPEVQSLAPVIPIMPGTWSQPHAATKSVELVGTGLPLFGLRPLSVTGREPERDRLWRQLETVHDTGTMRVVLIEGPEGIGKSGLVRWLCERGHEVGASTTLRHSAKTDEHPREAVNRVLQVDVDDPNQVRHRFQSWLGLRGDDLREASILLGDSDRDHPSLGWATLLAALAQRRPLVLWLDDAHLSSETDRLLGALRLRDPSVLVIVTVRDDLVTATDRASLVEAADECIALGPLDLDAHRRLINQLLPLEDALAARLVDRTAGNPLFAVHLVTTWVERGLLQPAGAVFSIPKGDALSLPESFSDYWRGRVEDLWSDLDEPALAGLGLAAARGHTISEHHWTQALKHLGYPPVPGAMHRLVTDRLAMPCEGGWTLAHGMIREAILERCAHDGTLEGMHIAWAKVLDDPTEAEARGRHLFQARRYDECRKPLLKAAHNASGEGYHRRALMLTDEALEALEHSPSTELTIKAEACRAAALFYLGTNEEAYDLIHRVIDKANAAGLVQWQGIAARTLAHVATRLGKTQEATEAIATSLRVFRALGNESMLASTLGNIAILSLGDGRPRAAIGHANEALAIRQSLNEPMNVARTLGNLAQMHLAIGDAEEAEALARRALVLYTELGQIRGQGVLWTGLGQIKQSREQPDQSIEMLRRAAELHRTVGNRFFWGETLAGLSRSLRHDQQFAEAEAVARDAARLGRAFRLPHVELSAHRVLAELAIEQVWPDATDHIQRALASAVQLQDTAAELELRMQEAEAVLLTHDVDGARRLLDLAPDISSMETTHLELRLGALQAECTFRAGEPAPARGLWREVISLRQDFGPCLGRDTRMTLERVAALFEGEAP